MRSKRCSKCGETKCVDGFRRKRSRRDGLDSWCKECHRAHYRAYWEAHREEVLARQHAYNEAHREEQSAYHRAWREENRELIKNDHYRKKNEASREVATRSGEPWTEHEDKIIRTSDAPLLEIAIELGRTYRSVMSRRAYLRRKGVIA